jgi:hypothetical protein
MKEQIADYNPQAKRSWFRRKRQGLTNRVAPWIRHAQWKWHLLHHPVKYNPLKVPSSGVPVIVNNFNRLDLTRQQIDWLRTLEGVSAILIVDNNSDFRPLLDYYDSLASEPNIQVVLLGYNSWRKGAAELAMQLLKVHPYIIVTDPDLLPYPTTPPDLVEQLLKLMQQFPEINHIGTSLEINDLPDHNPLKSSIYNHESKYWIKRKSGAEPPAFLAPIDTTFAMYRQGSIIEALEPALRTDRPYTLKHIDWYQDPLVRTAEYNHYLRSARIYATWATELRSRLGL